MPSKHFINPIMSTSLDMIKYRFIYGLSDDVTEEFLGKKRNTYVQYKSYISEIQAPLVESPYLERSNKGSKGNRYADKLAHYWDNSNWGNQIYTLYGAEYEKKTPEGNLIGEEMARLLQGKGKENVCLSQSEEELLQRFGILANGGDGRFQLRTPGKWEKKEQNAMAALICFFSHFVPLPALGYSILQRWGMEDMRIPVILRGQSLFEPLWQENIYRCLLAMANDYRIQYCGVWMRPVDFDFRDNFLYEKNRNAYVKLMDAKGKTLWCQVPEKPLLCLRAPEEIEEGNLQNVGEFEDTFVIYEVELLMNQDINTDFLRRKARRIWMPLKEEDTTNQVMHIQTYNKAYPNWKTCVFTYQIPEREEEEFQRFIKSFGDYVYQSRRLCFGEEKKDMKGLYSLCHPYNSRCFLRRWENLRGRRSFHLLIWNFTGWNLFC